MEKIFKLPKDFAEKWLTGLRSGKFKQTKGVLFNGEGYCCLGVACITAGYTNEDLRNKTGYGYALIIESDDDKTDDVYSLAKNFSDIPKEIKGRAAENDLVLLLTDMNDDGEKSFEEIANWIEENVEFY